MSDRPFSLKILREWHTSIDEKARSLEELHQDQLECRRGCSNCCVDELSVFQVEAEQIVENCQSVLEQKPHPVGACAFLDTEGQCRIYEYRPYVCRTQGLPLRWVEEDDEELREYRDICELNDKEPMIETLAPEECWTLGESEGELAQMQFRAHGSEMNRLALRDLFKDRSE